MNVYVVEVHGSFQLDTLVVAAKSEEDAITYALAESDGYGYLLRHPQEDGFKGSWEVTKLEVRAPARVEGVLHQSTYSGI